MEKNYMLMDELRLECLKIAIERGGSDEDVVRAASRFFAFIASLPSNCEGHTLREGILNKEPDHAAFFPSH